MDSREGLSISREVRPGVTQAGHSLAQLLPEMQQRRPVSESLCVADRGALNTGNLAAPDALGNGCGVGARRRSRRKFSIPVPMTRWKVPATCAPGTGSTTAGCCPEQAPGDAHDRHKAVTRLFVKLSRRSSLQELTSSQGMKRFLTVEGDARLVVDKAEIAKAERRDVLFGIATNLRNLRVAVMLSRCYGLWQVEWKFCNTRTSLRVRPTWHRTPGQMERGESKLSGGRKLGPVCSVAERNLPVHTYSRGNMRRRRPCCRAVFGPRGRGWPERNCAEASPLARTKAWPTAASLDLPQTCIWRIRSIMLHRELSKHRTITGRTYATCFNIVLAGMQIARWFPSRGLQAMRWTSRISRA